MPKYVHRWKVDSEGRPVVKEMSEEMYRQILPINYEGVKYKHQGYEPLPDSGPAPVPLKEMVIGSSSSDEEEPIEIDEHTEVRMYFHISPEEWSTLSSHKKGGLTRKYRRLVSEEEGTASPD